jgi:hypothetical protein
MEGSGKATAVAPDIEIADLERVKNAIWDDLLQTPWGSAEAKALEERYVAICRKIRRRKEFTDQRNT